MQVECESMPVTGTHGLCKPPLQHCPLFHGSAAEDVHQRHWRIRAKTLQLMLFWVALMTAAPAWAVLDINKSFMPINTLPGQNSTVEITLFNSSQTYALSNVALVDVMPTNVAVSGAALSNSCGGSLTLVPNTQIAISGATVPVGSSGNSGTCTIRVPVTSTLPGTYVNRIEIGDVCGTENGTPLCNPEHAEATLIVNPLLPLTGTKSNANGSSHLHIGGTDRITVTITNPNPVVLTNVSFTDTLPLPLIVASVPNIGGTCPSSGGTVVAIAATNQF